MTILVKNKKSFKHFSVIHSHVVYIGRPSILGNPYSHLPNTLAEFQVKDRKEAIDKYREMFYNKINNDVDFRYKIQLLISQAKAGYDIYLVCWCKPLDCHGDIIKEYIEKQLGEK